MSKLTKNEKVVLAHRNGRDAKLALVLSIIGIIILPIVLDPIALFLSIRELRTSKRIDSDDSMSYALACVALVISVISLLIMTVAIITTITVSVR